MTTSNLSPPNVVSKEEWLAARKAFFLKEKAITHELDALRVERCRLPWVKVDKPYTFEGPKGKCTLADLFQDRSQLAVYHFMLTPGSDHVCKGCSFVADHIDAARQHFGDADLSFAAISRASLARIEQVKRALGWTFPWSPHTPATSTSISECRSIRRTSPPAAPTSITARRSGAAKI
jgi:predicted dithiol-disulfide oxidoreductase (DUF899 family)